jgi:CubicO group peptidase (beta-lactamase class C family)
MRRLAFLSVLLCGCGLTSAAQQPRLTGVTPNAPNSEARAVIAEKAVADRLQAFFEQKAEDGFSGEIWVSVRGRTLFREAYGHSGCSGDPIRVGGVYLIGSLVKDYTKLAIFKLADQQKLALDDPIGEYLPGLASDLQNITISMLAEHRSGLPDTIDKSSAPTDYSLDWDYEPVDRHQLLQRAAGARQVHEPDAERHYSNLGYSLLAAIIEVAAGTPYEHFLRQHIFTPLGMQQTGYVSPNLDAQQLIDGCRDGQLWPMPSVDRGWLEDGPSWNLRGNGGMVGTADDIGRWMGAFHGKDLLSNHFRDAWLSTVMGTSKTFQSRAVGAGGSNGIYNAYYLLLTEPEVSLVMLSNNEAFLVERYKDEVFAIIADGLISTGSK